MLNNKGPHQAKVPNCNCTVYLVLCHQISPQTRFEPHIGDNAWIERILCSWQCLDRPDDQFVSGHKSCLDFVYSLWQIVTKSLNAGECEEYLELCVCRSRRWFEGDGKMELMDDRGRFVHRHHHHNKLYKKEGSSRLTPEFTEITALISHHHQRQQGQVESDSSSSSSSSSPPSPWSSSEVWRTWQVIEEGLVIISPWDHFARLPPALWPSFACLAAVSLLSSNTNTKPSQHQIAWYQS